MNRLNKHWKEWRGSLLFIFLFFVFRSAVADWYEVPTGSMKPTIIEGDRIFVNKLAYDIKIPFTLASLKNWDAPARGDVVVFDSPIESKRLIKRVVGLPGDVIVLRNNRLIINNQPATYSLAEQSKIADYWDTSDHAFLDRKPILINESFDNMAPHLITVLSLPASSPAKNFGPYKVPEDHFFMLGDSRDNSADSRYIGPIHQKYILGKANRIVLSFQRTDRFFIDLN